jgi:hypothetical protein
MRRSSRIPNRVGKVVVSGVGDRLDPGQRLRDGLRRAPRRVPGIDGCRGGVPEYSLLPALPRSPSGRRLEYAMVPLDFLICRWARSGGKVCSRAK